MGMKKNILFVLILTLAAVLGGCNAKMNMDATKSDRKNTPTDTPTVTQASSIAPTIESKPTATQAPTSTPTPEPTPTPLPTNTPTPEPTTTPVPTSTPTPKPTATPVPTNTPTPKPTATPVPTPAYTYTELNKTMYAKSSVNVRDLPSSEGKKIGSLSAYERVTVVGQCNETDWYRIVYNNKTAYVSNNYLVDNLPTPTPRPTIVPTYESINTEIEDNYFDIPLPGTFDKELAKEIFILANEIRKEHGLNELIWDGCLYESARVRAAESSLYFSHTRLDGTDCFTIYDKLHGENLATGYSTAKSVVNAWMSSEGHRENILRDNFTRGSIAVFQTITGWYFCQHFGY